MKKKLAILITSFTIGGAESMTANLILHYNREKYDIRVFCLYSATGSKYEKQLLKAGVELIFINKPLGLHLSAMFRLNRLLTEFNPDIVHSNSGLLLYLSVWLLKSRKHHVLHTVHNIPQYEVNSLQRSVSKIFYRTGKAEIIAISENIRKQFVSFYHLSPQNIHVIPNPVDTAVYYPEKHNLGEKLVFLNVARLVHEKNQIMLLKAFLSVVHQFPKSQLWIAGSGELKPNLEAFIKENGLEEKAVLLGNVEDMPALYRKADIFVLSSIAEGLPISMLEAMASGLPVIATEVGGIPDVLDNNVGILVESEHEDALADALKKIAENTDYRKSMSSNARSKSMEYDITNAVEKYEKLYELY